MEIAVIQANIEEDCEATMIRSLNSLNSHIQHHRVVTLCGDGRIATNEDQGGTSIEKEGQILNLEKLSWKPN